MISDNDGDDDEDEDGVCGNQPLKILSIAVDMNAANPLRTNKLIAVPNPLSSIGAIANAASYDEMFAKVSPNAKKT